MQKNRQLDRLQAADLNLLLVLDAMIATNSTTEAAELVGRTQSAISMSVNRLRDLFGDPLFVRKGQGLAPTPLTNQLAEPLRRLLFDAQMLFETNTRFDPQVSSRHFKVAFSEYVMHQALEINAQIAAKAPSCSASLTCLGLREADYGWGERALLSGSADLLINFYRSEVSAGLETIKLPTQRWITLGQRLNDNKELTLQGWLARPHILVSSGEAGRSPVGDALSARNLDRTIGLVTSSLSQALYAATRSDMLVTAMAPVVLPLADSLGLIGWRTPLELPEVSMSLIVRDRKFDPASEWLAEVASSCFEKSQ